MSTSEPEFFTQSSPFKTKRRQPVIIALEAFVIILFLAIFSYLFIATPHKVNGDSMNPLFTEGDLLFVNKFDNLIKAAGLEDALGIEIKRGDIIVAIAQNGEEIVKRVISLPGESIRISSGGAIYIDSERIIEPYLSSDVVTRGGDVLPPDTTVIVPENHYVLLGDNRENSQDSRHSQIGFVAESQIIGKVLFQYSSTGNIGVIRGEAPIIAN